MNIETSRPNRFSRFAVVMFFCALFATGVYLLLPEEPLLESLLQTEQIEVGDVTLEVVFATTPKGRRAGLSDIPYVRPGQGMLFVFEESDKHEFWMKDMLISLDIIWIDENLKVTEITPNLAPESFPEVFVPEVPSKYVLEIPAGQAALLRIAVGDILVLPELSE